MTETEIQRKKTLTSDRMTDTVRREARAFWEDESGVGVIEIVLILVGILTP